MVTTRAAVVVPYWGAELGEDDRISLRHLERFLGRYDRYVVGEPLAAPRLSLR